MLCLGRKQSEQIKVGENIVVTVVRISANKVTLGIQAPKELKITRTELKPKDAA